MGSSGSEEADDDSSDQYSLSGDDTDDFDKKRQRNLEANRRFLEKLQMNQVRENLEVNCTFLEQVLNMVFFVSCKFQIILGEYYDSLR